jgi:heptosyltransferase-2
MPKFLLLRFSSIGDIVLTTPVVRCLKQQVPGAEIHFLTRKPFEAVLRHNPYIDRLISFDKKPAEVLDELRKEQYDVVIDLHHNRRSFFLKRALARPSHSFRKLNIQKWLLVNFKWNRMPELHIVDRYLETVKGFGVSNDGKGLDYFTSTSDEGALDKLPASHRSGYTVIAIGAQHGTKRLPEEKIADLCKRLDRPVVLSGGKEDAQSAERIALENINVFNGCGVFTLNESAAVVKRAQAVVAHDTGMMHIAAAFKRPIISIWGNTVPSFGMYPYYGDSEVPNRRFEVEGLTCRPCSKIGFDRCPKGHFRCMNNQDIGAIADTVREWLR